VVRYFSNLFTCAIQKSFSTAVSTTENIQHKIIAQQKKLDEKVYFLKILPLEMSVSADIITLCPVIVKT
jgi:hypothetical protein